MGKKDGGCEPAQLFRRVDCKWEQRSGPHGRREVEGVERGVPFKLGEVTACSCADGHGLPKRNTEERESPCRKSLSLGGLGLAPKGVRVEGRPVCKAANIPPRARVLGGRRRAAGEQRVPV